MKGLLARKLGMTQLFNPDGTVTAVTVLEGGPCKVLGLRTAEKDGYNAVRIAFWPAKEGKLNNPQLGEFKKAGLDGYRHIVEIRGYDGVETGQELKAEIFAAGELVDVTSTSKGKGFQGLIKRHKFSRGPESHGSMNVRQPGAIGATDAARVFKGVRMAGQMANARQGTASTKTRATARGGGAKPYRQKGTGRARHGSTREPSMKGGATVFGPKPRDYAQRMPKQMRRLALRSALSQKAIEERI